MLPSTSVVITIIVFSIVQSVVGVGLLVFGTPTLLLLGYSYTECLSYLLPSALAVSFSQVVTNWQRVGEHKKLLLIWCLPAIFIGLGYTVSTSSKYDFGGVIGIFLLVTALVRVFRKAELFLYNFFSKFSIVYIFIMGLVHGLSNMGGGMLTIMMSNFYQNKNDVRANIAYGYCIFMAIQIVVLLFLDSNIVAAFSPILLLIALATYSLTNAIVFKKLAAGLYKHIITFIMTLYGLVLIFSA